jgi:hypothetical protein
MVAVRMDEVFLIQMGSQWSHDATKNLSYEAQRQAARPVEGRPAKPLSSA